jgi:hypothetical protein
MRSSTPGRGVTVPSPQGRQRFPVTLWTATLSTFQHVTDDDVRTRNALKFMPWIVAVLALSLVGMCVLAALFTGHFHAGVIARSTAIRWAGGLVAVSTLSGVAVVTGRRRGVPTRRTSAAAPKKKQCPQHDRAQPVSLPGGRYRHGQRHDRPHR